jgi:hypothetical protein
MHEQDKLIKIRQPRDKKHMHFLCIRETNPIRNPNRKERDIRIPRKERKVTSNPSMNPLA